MMEYATATDVPVERSKAELEKMLRRAGAEQYGTSHDDARGIALVFFKLGEHHIRMAVPLPKLSTFNNDGRGRPVSLDVRARRFEQACRSRWRGLVLIVKGKLQLIAWGLSTSEREFLPDITFPDGRTVGDVLRPIIKHAYLTGSMPMALLEAHDEEGTNG
jgi:hypothetical protein